MKNYIKASLFLLMVLVSSSAVSAGWFDWLDKDKDLVGEAYIYGGTVREQVKCVFSGSDREQVCYGTAGRDSFKCRGAGSCVAYVNGRRGTRITWKSSCGGYAYTTVDGTNDVAEFRCGTDVTESVKCVMWDAASEQECYSSKGSCTAQVQTDSRGRTYAACYVENITGKKGERVTWKSSCGGYAYTTVDGTNDVAEFRCSTDMNESVKCVFYNATKEEQCYSEKGSCSAYSKQENGIATCGVSVTGKQGEMVTWKSSCGGYAYTLMDGQDQSAEFRCSIPVVTNVTEPGYYKAHWECYDGYHIEAASKKQLALETWRGYAKDDCVKHCYENGSKCGVNSFGTYTDAERSDYTSVTSVVRSNYIDAERSDYTSVTSVVRSNYTDIKRNSTYSGTGGEYQE